MSLKFLRRPQREDEPLAAPSERPEVRQYRYLLSTATFPTLERLHREALGALDPLVRAQVLRTVQERLLAGRDLTVDDVGQIARLLTMAEVRTPGLVVGALTDMAIARLAGAVLGLAAAQAGLDGYDSWSGADPDPRDSVRRLPAAPRTQTA